MLFFHILRSCIMSQARAMTAPMLRLHERCCEWQAMHASCMSAGVTLLRSYDDVQCGVYHSCTVRSCIQTMVADPAYTQAADSHYYAVLCSQSTERLNHIYNVETRFYCPQTFLCLDFQCRDDVSEVKQTFWHCKELPPCPITEAWWQCIQEPMHRHGVGP